MAINPEALDRQRRYIEAHAGGFSVDEKEFDMAKELAQLANEKLVDQHPWQIADLISADRKYLWRLIRLDLERPRLAMNGFMIAQISTEFVRKAQPIQLTPLEIPDPENTRALSDFSLLHGGELKVTLDAFRTAEAADPKLFEMAEGAASTGNGLTKRFFDLMGAVENQA